jgi:hypothetical protein
MKVICLEDAAFFVLVEKVLERFTDLSQPKKDKWISGIEAMELLHITSKTTLQKLRDEKKIRASQPEKRIILYDRDSIIDYLEDFIYETF